LVAERYAGSSASSLRFPARHSTRAAGYRVVERRDWGTRGGLAIAAVDMEKMLLSP